MSSERNNDAKSKSSAVLRYDAKVPRLELKTDIAGLTVGQMAALDELGMLSRPAKPEPEPEPFLVAPDEDISEINKPETSDEVYAGTGPVMPHNPPPPRALAPRSVLFQRHQAMLDARAARKSLKEKPRIVKCSDLRIRF